MRNDENEEPLEAEGPSVRMNPENPGILRVERIKNMMRFTEIGVLLVSKVEVLVDKKEKEQLRSSDQGFLTRKRRHVSNSYLSRQQVWSNGSDVL